MRAYRLDIEHMQTLLILLIVGVILYNLGAGLYYMLVDKGRTKRTVNALTRRVAFSVLLIALIIIGIATGLIQPHGIHG
jgi:succinate dehydrogenase/fumarate reductase cytochrome b subunit